MHEIHIRFTFNCSWQRIRFDVEVGLISLKRIRLNYPVKLIEEKTYTISKMEYNPEDKNFFVSLTNMQDEPPPFGPWLDFLIEHTDLANNLVITVEKSDDGLLKLEKIVNGTPIQIQFIREPLSSPTTITVPLKQNKK